MYRRKFIGPVRTKIEAGGQNPARSYITCMNMYRRKLIDPVRKKLATQIEFQRNACLNMYQRRFIGPMRTKLATQVAKIQRYRA